MSSETIKLITNRIASSAPYLAGFLLLIAGGTKATQLTFPAPLVSLIQIGNPILWILLLSSLEIALGLCLIFAEDKKPLILFTICLFVLFTGYVMFAHFHLKTGCGCGAGEQWFSGRLAKFTFSMFRNGLALCLLLLYYVAYSRQSASKTEA